MFVLVPLYSIDTEDKKAKVYRISIAGGLAVVFLFLGNMKTSYNLQMLFFITANILMTGALAWQQIFTLEMYQTAADALAKFPPKKRLTEAYIEASSKVDVTANQFRLATVMSIVYTIFPVLYYLRSVRYLDFESFTIGIFCVSFVAKFLYSHVLFEVNNAVLDFSMVESLDEKQRQSASRQMLLRYVFHEIRVPLNSLALGLQYLKEQEAKQSDGQAESVTSEVLDMMQEGAHFMSETLNDVLSFQKIEDGALELERVWFDPRKLLKTISSTFKAQLTSKHISLIREVDPKLPTLVFGDQFRLEHVLSNFVSNAIKFSSERSQIFVGISYKTRGPDLVTFFARDQGIGISKEDQSKLFKVFSQIKPGELQKGNGSGLGLSICKTLVEMHGGEIGCDSTPRKSPDDIASGGSEFYFSIKHDEAAAMEYEVQKYRAALEVSKPNLIVRSESTNSLTIYPSSVDTSAGGPQLQGSDDKKQRPGLVSKYATPSTKSIESLTSAPSSNDVTRELAAVHNILIVDDSQANCKMLRILPLQRGVKVCDACFDGTESLQLVLHTPQHPLSYYDIIFMDSNMPKMNGQDAATKLREAGFTNLLIGLTGDAMEEDVALFEAAGADAVIPKPMKATTLDRLLHYCESYNVTSPSVTGSADKKKQFKSFLFSR